MRDMVLDTYLGRREAWLYIPSFISVVFRMAIPVFIPSSVCKEGGRVRRGHIPEELDPPCSYGIDSVCWSGIREVGRKKENARRGTIGAGETTTVKLVTLSR